MFWPNKVQNVHNKHDSQSTINCEYILDIWHENTTTTTGEEEEEAEEEEEEETTNEQQQLSGQFKYLSWKNTRHKSGF